MDKALEELLLPTSLPHSKYSNFQWKWSDKCLREFNRVLELKFKWFMLQLILLIKQVEFSCKKCLIDIVAVAKAADVAVVVVGTTSSEGIDRFYSQHLFNNL